MNLNPEERAHTQLIEERTLERQAQGIWASIIALIDTETHLPADTLFISKEKTVSPPTSPTNLGLTLLAFVAARELNLIGAAEAETEVTKMAIAIVVLLGFSRSPLNWYDSRTAKPLEKWPETGSSVSPTLSSVDTAWLVAGLYGAAQAFPDIPDLDLALRSIDLSIFYDATSHLCVGSLSPDGTPSAWKYEVLSEARIISYIGVALGQIPPEHLHYLWASTQAMQKKNCPDAEKKHPHTLLTWGGSMFEILMLSLIFDEGSLAAVWQESLQNHVLAQYAVADPDTGLWGSSPTFDGIQYSELGIPGLGMCNGEGYGSTATTATGEKVPVVTLHALYMALMVRPDIALATLNHIVEAYPGSWSGFGLPDSFAGATPSGDRLLILNQCMSFLALAQYLKSDCVRKYFASLQQRLQPLMGEWVFESEPSTALLMPAHAV